MFTSGLITVLCFAYLIASLNTAILVSHLLNLPSPIKEGSKNPGTTNVLRLGGKNAAALTLIGDLLKGYFPLALARYLELNDFGLGLIALTCVIGHIFPLFFNFKGGKGIATMLGAALGLSFTLGFLIIIAWLITAIISRYSSLASLVSVFILLLLSPLFLSWTALFPLAALCGLIIWRHQDNIERLKMGTERMISFGKESTDSID